MMIISHHHIDTQTVGEQHIQLYHTPINASHLVGLIHAKNCPCFHSSVCVSLSYSTWLLLHIQHADTTEACVCVGLGIRANKCIFLYVKPLATRGHEYLVNRQWRKGEKNHVDNANTDVKMVS